MKKLIEIKLCRSLIGQRPGVHRTAKSLKLGRIGSSAVFERNPSLEGQIRVVRHLVSVKELKES